GRMDVSFHGRFRTCGGPSVDGAARLRFKGPASLAVDPGHDKRVRAHRQARGWVRGSSADLRPSPRSPYPQKLWITLWVSIPPWVKFPGYIAYLLQWLKNDQLFLSCFINDLRTHHLPTWLDFPIICSFYVTARPTCE